MKKRFPTLIVAMLISLGTLAQTLEPLHVDGRYLKNQNGDIVTLHGYMSVLEPYFQADGYEWEGYDVATCLKNKKEVTDRLFESGWKMDYVRFKLDAYWCCERLMYNGKEYKTFEFDKFKKYFEEVFIPLIDYYHEKGIYTLLWPPHTTPDVIEVGDKFQEHLLLVWDYVSNHPHIKNNPGIMFELANEPIVINCRQGKNDEEQFRLNANGSMVYKEGMDFWQPIVDVIRSHCDNIIFIPGFYWDSAYAGFPDYPVKGHNIGYAVHSYPQSSVREDWEEFKFPTAYMAPIIITENSWGNLGHKDSILTTTYGKPLKDIVDELGNVSWNCYEPEEDYYFLVNSSLTSVKAVSANNPEHCFLPMYQWWNEYSKTKVLPTNQLKVNKISFDEFPKAFKTGQKALAKIKAEFTNGMTWDVSGDIDYSISDPDILSIKHGVVCALKEGSATVIAKYTDGTGQSFSQQIEVTSTLFPLTTDEFNPNIHLDGTFNEAMGTFSATGPCTGGWSFSGGRDLSAYKTLVIQLNEKQHCSAMVRIWDDDNVWGDDEAWNDEKADIGFDFKDNTELAIDLQTLHKQNGQPLDLKHIYHVGIWINGDAGVVSIKRLFLSNDGVEVAYQMPCMVYADNKVMYYGDEVPTLTYSNSGSAINGTPTLTTTASSASPVGTYPITIERGSVANESAAFIDGTLTVLERPVVSGIRNVIINRQTDRVYNLSGQRLSKAQKGINIIEGKKVVIK